MHIFSDGLTLQMIFHTLRMEDEAISILSDDARLACPSNGMRYVYSFGRHRLQDGVDPGAAGRLIGRREALAAFPVVGRSMPCAV